MAGTIIHLLGTPGVGKYTIGKQVAALTGARLIDNHSIANVIFQVLEVDGVKPLPDGVWPLVGQVRAAVMDAIARLSPPGMSFVFTNYAREDDEDHRLFDEMVTFAAARESAYIPVLLRCETPELERRIVTPDRKERMKLVDPLAGARLNDLPPFATDHPNGLVLEVTRLEPPAAAQRIVDWAGDRGGR